MAGMDDINLEDLEKCDKCERKLPEDNVGDDGKCQVCREIT